MMAFRQIKYLFLPVLCLACLIQNASAASCRWFAKDAQSAIKRQVSALQRVEHEASDRLKGLDTRPFEVLRDEAKKTATAIAEPKGLADEESLKRCRNATQPIRRICADAAQLLVEILVKHAAESKPDYDKARYASAIAECEKLMKAKLMKSLIRGTE